MRLLLKQLKLTAPQRDDATLAVLNSDGAVLAATSGTQLFEASTISGLRLIEFLNPLAPPLPDAEKLLSAALAQAKREHKRVLVHSSTPFSETGLLLARYLDAQKSLLEKDYVCLRLDPRFPNGTQVIRSLGQRLDSGALFVPIQDSDGTIRKVPSHLDELPWITILDADGKILITSADAGGTVGFPAGKRRTAHFRKMIRETATRLTDAEIHTLIRGLSPAPSK